MAVIIGRLDTKVILRAPVQTQNDEAGIQTAYPADTIDTFCHVKKTSYLSGNGRKPEGGTTALINTKEIFIRHCARNAAVHKDCQVELKGKVYLIHGIEKVGEQFIQITIKGK